MSRYATTIRFTNADGSISVDFSGCRGYLDGAEQFNDDDIRESLLMASDGTPRFQAVVMGATPHRGNRLGVTFDARVASDKVTALYALNKAVKAAGSYMKAYLVDATSNIDAQKCKADPEQGNFWLVRGRESEGMIEGVRIFLIAIP
jgi:hypothetical protein